MTNSEKELLSVASEVMEALRSNGLACALSGSLMLAVAGINKRREANDIDIVVDLGLFWNQYEASGVSDLHTYAIGIIEDKCGTVVITCKEGYPDVSFRLKGIKVDLIMSSEEYSVVNGVVCGSLFNLLCAKHSYSIYDGSKESKTKHSEDVSYIFDNNALGFSRYDLISSACESSETGGEIDEFEICPF